MKVAVIDYNAGNTRSVFYALQRLGIETAFTDRAEEIRKSDKVIFPGVGEANSTMAYLKTKGLDLVIKSLTQPVLGICLGMQLLCKYSEENDTSCLGLIDVPVKRFNSVNGEKVPHMGWNKISDLNSNLFDPGLEGQFVYFVHSFFVPVCDFTIAQCDYINPFSAAIKKDNFYATQFHPEKSGPIGAEVLNQFLKAC